LGCVDVHGQHEWHEVCSTWPAIAIYVYESVDQGQTWTRFGTPFTTLPQRVTGGVWEPEFAVDNAGELVMFYSDSSQYYPGTSNVGHNQMLMQVKNTSGTSTGWSSPQQTVASSDATYRPGMITVSKLPDDHWFMTYELCIGSPNCTSTGGWNYGTVTDMGTAIQTTQGETLHHAPTNKWMTSQISPINGSIIVTGQVMETSSGATSALNGTKLFVNNAVDGAGPWYLIDAPVHIPGADGNIPCNNYSNSILPGGNGLSILEFSGQYSNFVSESHPGPCSTVFNRDSWNNLPSNGSTSTFINQPAPSLCLDSTGGVSANATAAEIETCTRSTEQLWTVHRQGTTGYFTVQNNLTGLCLDNTGGSNRTRPRSDRGILCRTSHNGPSSIRRSHTSCAGGF
jgi:hypothetical protein